MQAFRYNLCIGNNKILFLMKKEDTEEIKSLRNDRYVAYQHDINIYLLTLNPQFNKLYFRMQSVLGLLFSDLPTTV
ncbi:hypothetical protein MSBR3_0644 [Methanosarcina barkeri 3]|uniref:Uncharacterized protein n=1 Tax=Methanosarcina barkeri 3 TaxID=1434107 RepID=A0A0E3SK51_METBA|nr:hypothetical protein MSBR3_0644 [Methanosarcina barkeri 3]